MEHLRVVGQIKPDGSFTPSWWRNDATRPTQSLSSPTDASAWTVVLLDADDAVIAQAHPIIRRAFVCPGDSYLILEALIPILDEGKAVSIRERGRESYRRIIRPKSTLNLEGPLGSASNRKLQFRVTIQGASPGEGSYVVAYWEVTNSSKLPIGEVDLRNGKSGILHIPLDDVPGGENRRVVVIYHDGIRTTETSTKLSLPLRPSRAVILEPNAETLLFERSWLSLEGDLEGDGDAESLQWFIDEKHVATGRRNGTPCPEVGHHTIVLRSGEAMSSLDIQVREVPLIAAGRWTPHWRGHPVILIGASTVSDTSKETSYPEHPANNKTPLPE